MSDRKEAFTLFAGLFEAYTREKTTPGRGDFDPKELATLAEVAVAVQKIFKKKWEGV